LGYESVINMRLEFRTHRRHDTFIVI